MNIVVLNGNPKADNAVFEDYLEQLSAGLEAEGHEVAVLRLREMEIKHCAGCWGCWVKTPGECVFADDTREMRRQVMQSDLVLWASPVIMGFYSSLLKTATDKFLPLIHPYGVIDQGEVHHRPRYDRYPLTGLLLAKGEDTDDEDIAIITDIHRRTTLNFKSSMALARLTDDPVEEVVNEINRL
jgi:multimeric flavodoxin WrbA